MGAITGDWADALSGEFQKPYYQALYRFIREEYATQVIYPPSGDIFNALHLTPLKQVKVLILGQDPYHEPGQAHGLCFSVKKGVPLPPSLVNIYQELKDDLGIDTPQHGCLEDWARQGVLLLNTLLTVRAHRAFSHKDKGWETFTDAIIRTVNDQPQPIVCMLWGKPAQEKAKYLTNPAHLVLKAPHPSPLSAYRGFFGCRHFSKCNRFLESKGVSPVDWHIHP